jgi:hypothetical protein
MQSNYDIVHFLALERHREDLNRAQAWRLAAEAKAASPVATRESGGQNKVAAARELLSGLLRGIPRGARQISNYSGLSGRSGLGSG